MELYETGSFRLAMLASTLQACCNLSLWCFGTEGKFYFTTSAHEQELRAFLEIGGCKEYALTEGRKLDKPFIMSDPLGLLWVGEYYELTENMGMALVLMGPSFVSEMSVQTIEERMRARNVSQSMRGIGRRILMDVPILTMPMLHQYTKMLHFTATQKVLQLRDIVYQSDISDASPQGEGEPPVEKHFMDYERSNACEQVILQCIRDGNMNYTQAIGEIGLRAVPDNYMTGDSLREAKDTVIIFVALCSRAAVEGKLSIKAAKEIEVRYIRRLERCKTITEIINLRQAALAEYVARVHELKAFPGVSQPIRDCCDYVKAHFMEPLELADIAKSVCYTEYYLTRKFQREMGLSLRDYILNTRLEYAKIQLISTEDSVRQISEKLQFGTRNYFTRVFREKEGCTPVEYRERARTIGL